MVVMKKDPESGEYQTLPNPAPGEPDEVCKTSRLYTYLGLQTDYGKIGRGVISPKMVTAVLQQAATM